LQLVADRFNKNSNPPAQNRRIFYLRRLLPLLVLFITSSYCIAQAKLAVKDAKKNFGFVKQGTLVKNEFEINNTGNAPLIINDAKVECSCTSVDYPKQPLMPGQQATISVSFNTSDAYGRQDRVVELYSNDPASPGKLRFKGVVLKK
jgi:hypothetical protein